MKKFYILVILLPIATFSQIVQLKNIFAGSSTAVPPVVNSGNPNNFFDYNGILYFRATEEINGIELWKTDGTSVGTVLVKNIAATTTNSNPANFTSFNASLFFTATTGTAAEGIELWKTNGTDAGTTMVKDIRPGVGSSSNPQNLLVLNPTTMLFDANDGTIGGEIWKTDGTNAGTINVIDYPGTANTVSWSENLNGTAILGQIITATGREIYKSDGTAINSNLVLDIAAATTNGVGAASFKALNSVFFQGNSGTTGFELWKTNGTAAGTVLVKDINVGTIASAPSRFAELGTNIYFKAVGANGDELWKSDGTELGTVEVVDINVGSGNSIPTAITSVSGAIYFFATDATLYDLYKYDGTTLIKLLDCNATVASVVTNFVLLNGFVYFGVDSNSDTFRELWRTNGTAAGTVSVASLFTTVLNPLGVNNITVSNNKLFFSGSLDDGIELMMFDPATLSISDNEKLNQVSIYPNPSNGALFVDYIFNETALYDVFDMVEKKVASGTIIDKKINLTLNLGIYILKIQSGNTTINRKIIIN